MIREKRKLSNGLPVTVSQTVNRRDWMSWVGRATVLSLSGSILTRCSGFDDDPIDSPSSDTVAKSQYDAGTDIDNSDAGSDEHPETSCERGGNYPFEPRDISSDLAEKWPIRTVDGHDLTEILSSWRLVVDGMVGFPLTLTFNELLSLGRLDQIVDFHCVEGWSVYDVPWNGFHIQQLVERVSPIAGATHITFHTIGDAYNESLPIQVALEPKTMLAFGIDCNTIPYSRGFPLRLVVPRLLAYKSAKYVTRLEFTDAPIDGYWVQRGYPYDAEVPINRLRAGKY